MAHQESEHIPEEMRYRSYGCGSPVLEADIQQGDIVVDLGSGTGIECFIASKQNGQNGQVIGIDMGDAMLDIANKTKQNVVKELGYNNISFKKAFLEKLPINDQSVNTVISNCVINLSSNKREVFQEIFRILKPNGRLIISDITYNDNIPLEIKYNETLRGASIGVGIAFSILLSATPYDGKNRQISQQATHKILGDIASNNAPRCCQRDSWITLQGASKLLKEKLGKKLTVSHHLVCKQFEKNKYCIHNQCPLWPSKIEE